MAISAHRSQLIWSPLLGWILIGCAGSVAYAQLESSSPAAEILFEQTPAVDIPADVPVISGGGGPTTSETGIAVGAFTLFPSIDVQGGYDSNVYATSAPTVGSPYVLIRPVVTLKSEWLKGGGGPTTSETGIAVGAFTLFPSIDVQGGYDSNVYATSAPTVGSPYVLIRPVVTLKSEWLNHSLRVAAGGGFGFYSNATSQNYWNGYIQADGRLDIQEDFYATGMVAVRRQTEALGTPNSLVASSPTVVDSIPVEIGLYQRFNRFFYDAKVSATRYRYIDYSIIPDGGLPAGSRDRMEYEERIRLGYEIIEGVDVWVSPGLNQRIYDQYINAYGQQRDSTGWFVNVGATVKFTEKTKLEGFIGYTNQTFLADGSTTPAFTFGLIGSWNGYEPLTLRPAFMRSVNESAYSDYQNYVSTSLGIDFTYDIHDAWKMVGGTGLNIAQYNPVAGSGLSPRTDYYWRASLGLLYSLRPQVQIGPLYEHTSGSSTDPANGGPAYTREVISLRVVATR